MVTLDELNLLSGKVLDCAFRVHSNLGPGLLESTYEACLIYELKKLGLIVERQVAVPVIYDGVKLVDVGYRIDILVEAQLVLELKAVDSLAPIHRAQLLSYLRHSNRRLGLLINFNVERLKDGIVRQINGY